MQDYYGLEWIFEERLDKVNYMEITMAIREDWIIMLLYEKSMNLYLFTPPSILPTPQEC